MKLVLISQNLLMGIDKKLMFQEIKFFKALNRQVV